MSVITHTLTGIPLHVGVMGCAGIVVLYTYVGGMWAVSVTDFIQSIMIFLGLVVLSVTLYQQVGGLAPLVDSQPEGFFRFVPKWEGSAIALYFSAWITVGLGSIPQQDIFQRVMSAKSERTAVGASYLAGFLYLTIGCLPLFIGLCGRYLYPEINGGESQMTIPLIVLQHGSIALQILFFGALLSAILSTTSGAMLAPATVIGENIVKRYVKNLSDKGLLRVMRLSIVAVAVCSTGMALYESNIYHLAEVSSSLSLVSLFIPLAAGLYWKRASERGAVLSIVLGMLVWGVCSYWDTTFPPNVFGLGSSILGMVVGSLVWPDASQTAFEAWKAEAE
jgi:Na+/proline symporter